MPVDVASLKHKQKDTMFDIIAVVTVKGAYQLKCRFDKARTVTSGPRFGFYDVSKATVSRVVPAKIPVNKETNVTLEGSGFQNTDELRCFGSLARKKLEFFHAKYINTTAIVCSLPRFKTSRVGSLGVSFSKRETNQLFSKCFSVYEDPPTALSAQFYNCLARFKIVFDKNVKPSRRYMWCTKFFRPESMRLLGKKPICRIRGRELHVMLRSSATLMPGDVMLFLTNSVKGAVAADENPGRHPEVALVVGRPSKQPSFDVSLLGPSRSIGT